MSEKNGVSILELIISGGELAALTSNSERTIRRLAAQGIIKPARNRNGQPRRARYIAGEACPKICEYLRDLSLADDPHETLYRASRARRMTASADSAELELKLQRGDLHRGSDLNFLLGNMFVAARDRLRAIPSRIMHSLVGQTDPVKIHTAIAEEIDAALLELSERKVSSMFSKPTRKYLAKELGCAESEVERVMKDMNGEGSHEKELPS